MIVAEKAYFHVNYNGCLGRSSLVLFEISGCKFDMYTILLYITYVCRSVFVYLHTHVCVSMCVCRYAY